MKFLNDKSLSNNEIKNIKKITVSDSITINNIPVTSAKIGKWDTAHSWGDHSTAGYAATSHTHTITTTTTGDASTIVSTDSNSEITANAYNTGDAKIQYNSVTKSIDFIFDD